LWFTVFCPDALQPLTHKDAEHVIAIRTDDSDACLNPNSYWVYSTKGKYGFGSSELIDACATTYNHILSSSMSIFTGHEDFFVNGGYNQPGCGGNLTEQVVK